MLSRPVVSVARILSLDFARTTDGATEGEAASAADSAADARSNSRALASTTAPKMRSRAGEIGRDRLGSAKSRLRCSVLGCVVWLLGCHARPEPVHSGPVPASRNLVPLFHGDATEYVAAAGLRWLVVGSPVRLLEYPVLNRELGRLLPPERFDAFRNATALELRRVPEALVAGFDYGTLYLVMIPDSTRPIELKFQDRVTGEPIVRRGDPRVVRISGTVGGTPETLVSIDRLLVAFAIGDPTPARVVQAFATRRLKRSPSALQGAALKVLPPSLDRAEVRFYAPGPFTAEWQRGLGGLLRNATALGVAVEPRQKGETLLVTVAVAGDWPDTAKAQDLLRGTWQNLAASGLGRLVGLDAPRHGPELSATAELLGLSVEVAVRPLLSGLDAAVAADVAKMMDFGSGGHDSRPVAPKSSSPARP